MSVTWRKVWRDLVHNKARTGLVVLSTAVGVFALGLTFGLSGVMRERMTTVHRETVTAHIIFSGGPFTQEAVDTIRREPGVLDTQGEVDASLRWKLPGEDEWRSADLIARADYGDQQMELLRLIEGRWPEERILGVERSASAYYGIEPGSTILVEFGQREREVAVESIVRMHMVFPPQWGGDATFFATPDTADWLVGRDLEYNRLQVRLESFSQAAAEEAAEQIEDRLERMGLHVGRYSITDPEVHWQQEMIDGSMFVLATLGILSLGLSAFLIINTMNAIIAQQVWQIGVMKAVGATFSQLLRVYLATALSYGLLALLLAVPLGMVGAHWMAIWLLDLFNITLDTFQISVPAVMLQVVVGVSVPLVAALVPVIGGARTTAHKAISAHGIGSGFGDGWIDRLIGRVRRLPRPMVLSLRNTFRHKARVTLTLLTLILSGVIFTMTMSVNDSFFNTLEIIFDQLGEDIGLYFDRPYHVSRIVGVAESVGGVQRAEVWNGEWAMLPLASGEETPVYLRGVPAHSVMFKPRIVSGRSLLPSDGHAVLVNHRLAAEEGIRVGDEITLKIGEEEAVWTVVGLSLNISSDSDDFFVPFDTLAHTEGVVGRGTYVKIVCGSEDLEVQKNMIKALKDAYEVQRIEVTGHWSTSEERDTARATFGIMVSLLLSMAALAAIVGSIGLASTMSINVVERSREIGVMRAVGASSGTVASIFVVEGVFLGLLSWLFAAPVSLPGSWVFSDVLGSVVINFPLEFVYSTNGILLWFVIVVVLSALASLWPALRATRVSVREALAYE